MELALRHGNSSRSVTLGRSSLFPLIVATLLTCSLSGCATIVEGGAQTIQIETDPPDARCLLKRSGVAVSLIPSTPATVSVFKQNGDLALTCSKRGYLDATADQTAEFSGTVLGNVLFGGLIGAAIDMGSGATHKYPKSIFLTLIPERFDSANARDEFFAALIDRVGQRHREAVEQVRTQCAEGDCAGDIEKMNEAHKARLRAMEIQRQNAITDGAK